jgi:hypothetical protein
MQLRRGQIGVTPTGDGHWLATDDVIALVDHHGREPRAGAAHAAPVIDRQEELAPDQVREGHDPGVGSHDDGPHLGADVDAPVARSVGIVGRVEPADDRTNDRPRPWHTGTSGPLEGLTRYEQDQHAQTTSPHPCDRRRTGMLTP